MQQPSFNGVRLSPAGARAEGEYALAIHSGQNTFSIFARTTSWNIVRKILLLNMER